jgi:hypothetical protein
MCPGANGDRTYIHAQAASSRISANADQKREEPPNGGFELVLGTRGFGHRTL